MKRETFKKGYMILHFAVAVSIVLIGINILIGFGKGTVGVVKDVTPKIENKIYKIQTSWKASKLEKRFYKNIEIISKRHKGNDSFPLSIYIAEFGDPCDFARKHLKKDREKHYQTCRKLLEIE